MGTAKLYDQWEDVGKSYSTDQIEGFVVTAIPERRVKWLIEQTAIIGRMLEIPGAAKPAWWSKVRSKMYNCATWYCQVAVIPSFNRTEVLKERTTQGLSPEEVKTLNVKAQKLSSMSIDDYLDGWEAAVQRAMVDHVTITRRTSSSRIEKSKANKIAHAMTQEVGLIQHLLETLRSLSK